MKAAAAILAALGLTAALALPAGSAPAWTVANDASKPVATELTGVACVSKTRCFAVGYRETSDDDQPVIEQATGQTWSKANHPTPAHRTPSTAPPLTSLVCAAPGNCFAVGTYYNANSQAAALIHHWNGKAWGLMNAAAPVITRTPHVQHSPQTSFASVACPTITSCYAVGYYQALNGTISTLVEHWNGKVWAAQSAPTSSAVATVLRGVSCVTDKSCFAVGTAVSSSHNKPFVIRWNGTAWTKMTTPSLASATLDDVTCAAARVCFALGSNNATSLTSTLLEQWNGTKWSVVTLKNMPSASHLNSMACPTATTCIAVGLSKWTNAGFRPLAYTWNGTTWKGANPPTYPGSTSNWLDAIACRTPTVCRAVGTYQANGTYHSFIENFG